VNTGVMVYCPVPYMLSEEPLNLRNVFVSISVLGQLKEVLSVLLRRLHTCQGFRPLQVRAACLLLPTNEQVEMQTALLCSVVNAARALQEEPQTSLEAEGRTP